MPIRFFAAAAHFFLRRFDAAYAYLPLPIDAGHAFAIIDMPPPLLIRHYALFFFR